MKIDNIISLAIELLVICLAVVFMMKCLVIPMSNFDSFDTEIEKTALKTDGVKLDRNGENVTNKFTGADYYLSLAISDLEQPKPTVVRFYRTTHKAVDNSDYSIDEEDGVSSAPTDNYFEVNYSKDVPSVVLNKMTLGRKVIDWTSYNLDSQLPIMLHPKDDSTELSWYINYSIDDLSGSDKKKSKKHGWMQMPQTKYMGGY